MCSCWACFLLNELVFSFLGLWCKSTVIEEILSRYCFKYSFSSFSSHVYVITFVVIPQTLDILLFVFSFCFLCFCYFKDFIDICSSSDSFLIPVQCTNQAVKGILYFFHIFFFIISISFWFIFYDFYLLAYIVHLFLCVVCLLEILVPLLQSIVIEIIFNNLKLLFLFICDSNDHFISSCISIYKFNTQLLNASHVFRYSVGYYM